MLIRTLPAVQMIVLIASKMPLPRRNDLHHVVPSLTPCGNEIISQCSIRSDLVYTKHRNTHSYCEVAVPGYTLTDLSSRYPKHSGQGSSFMPAFLLDVNGKNFIGALGLFGAWGNISMYSLLSNPS